MYRVRFENILKLQGLLSIHNYDNQVVVFSTTPGALRVKRIDEPLEFDCFIISYVESGTARVSINGNEYFLDENSVCLLSTSHMLVIHEHSDDFVESFIIRKPGVFPVISQATPHRSAEMIANLYLHPVFNLSKEEMQNLVKCREYLSAQIDRNDYEDRYDLVSNAYERLTIEIGHILKSRLIVESKTDSSSAHRERIVRSLMSMISENFRKEHRAQYYADKMCYSLQYLNSLTNQLVSMSVSEMIGRMLYTASCNLISTTDKTIQEIAFELNFADQATFCKFFKKMSGQSPSEFRKSELKMLNK